MPHLILENKNLILFLNLKFNFMKRRGLIFNSRPNKTAVFALGLMLGLCPVSKAWADTNMKDSQVVAQAQKKVKGQVVDIRNSSFCSSYYSNIHTNQWFAYCINDLTLF